MCKTKKSTQAIEPSRSRHKPRTSKSFSSSRSNPNDPFSGNNSTNYDNFSKFSTASSVASLKSSDPKDKGFGGGYEDTIPAFNSSPLMLLTLLFLLLIFIISGS